jgi:transposase
VTYTEGATGAGAGPGTLLSVALTREVAGALSHAELVDLVVRQSALIDELRAVIAQQQAYIAQLEARIRDLEQQLAQRDRQDPTKRMPGLKSAATPRRRKDGPRKRRGRGFSRRQSPTPTAVVAHAAPVCPTCATPLRGGRARWRKEVLDLPPVAPARVIHHVYLERRCPNPACGRRVPPPAVSATELGVLRGRQRLGRELLAHIALLRAELRLPAEAIQAYLGLLHGLELGVGTIVAALHRVAEAGTATVVAIREAIRASPRVHADETGLRQDGTNGYLWSFSTERERYFVHGRRTKEMVDDVLGPAFAGTLVTDFYAAYDHYPGPHQRCWAHLLREIHALREQHPHDERLRAWAVAVHGVYTRARRLQEQALPPARRVAAQQQCEAELLALCQPDLAADQRAVPQAGLCRRLQKYLPELFTFVGEPAVPSTNNAAERSVRPVVIQRKISGGTRSAAGTRTFCTLATLFGTWRVRNLDPLVACRQLLLAHAASV